MVGLDASLGSALREVPRVAARSVAHSAARAYTPTRYLWLGPERLTLEGPCRCAGGGRRPIERPLSAGRPLSEVRESTLPKRRFDVLLIDFYGTICAGDRQAVAAASGRVLEAYHLPVTPQELAIRWGEEFFQILDQSNRERFQLLRECVVTSLRTTLAEFGVDADPRPYVADLEDYWADPPIYPDAIEFLADFGRPVCCVSNADTMPLAAAIKRHGLRFDAVMSSELARSYKPDPDIFRRALEMVGGKPETALHVGDSLHSDVGGAAGLGIATGWIRREERIHDIGNCRPDFIFSILTEIYRFIDA